MPAPDPVGVVEPGVLQTTWTPEGVYEHGEYRQAKRVLPVVLVGLALGVVATVALWPRWGPEAIGWGATVGVIAAIGLPFAQIFWLGHAWVVVLADGWLRAGTRVAVPLGAVEEVSVKRGWWTLMKARVRSIGDRRCHTRGPMDALVQVTYRDAGSGALEHVVVGTRHPHALTTAIEAVAKRDRRPDG